jgi:hypothetical protein
LLCHHQTVNVLAVNRFGEKQKAAVKVRTAKLVTEEETICALVDSVEEFMKQAPPVYRTSPFQHNSLRFTGNAG